MRGSIICNNPTEVFRLRKLSWAVYVKFSRNRLGVAQRVDRGTALLFHDRGTRRG